MGKHSEKHFDLMEDVIVACRNFDKAHHSDDLSDIELYQDRMNETLHALDVFRKANGIVIKHNKLTEGMFSRIPATSDALESLVFIRKSEEWAIGLLAIITKCAGMYMVDTIGIANNFYKPEIILNSLDEAIEYIEEQFGSDL